MSGHRGGKRAWRRLRVLLGRYAKLVGQLDLPTL